MGATVGEKVSKAIASGEIDDSRVVTDEEEDRESIVEKDQIEEMETSPINHHDKDFAKVGDDEDAELQRIKDEEEEEDNQERVPDIGPSEEKKEADEAPPRALDLEKAAAPKVVYSHVKTPDEVDDLPEHEVVNPDESMLEEIKSEMSYDLQEKIAKDESEKEVDVAKKDKSEGSIEALKENEEVEVHIEQKLVQKADMEPADDDENKEEADEDDKDICDNKEVDKLDNERMTQSDLNQTAAETQDNTQDEKAADAFVNNIYTTEGKQDPCDKVAENKQEDETKEETKAGDSFINDIYTSEGKQEETDEKKEEDTKDEAMDEKAVDSTEDNREEAQVEKGIFKLKKNLEDEKEQDEKIEGTIEAKAADSFVNDVYTSEGKQEQIETIGEINDQEEKKYEESGKKQDAVEEEDIKEEKAADSFVNDIYTSEGKQEPSDEMANKNDQENTKEEVQEEEKAA